MHLCACVVACTRVRQKAHCGSSLPLHLALPCFQALLLMIYVSKHPALLCRLAVAGERELAFFPGSGQGAVHPGFQYETEHGAVCCRLSFRAGLPKDSHTIQVRAGTCKHCLCACSVQQWWKEL